MHLHCATLGYPGTALYRPLQTKLSVRSSLPRFGGEHTEGRVVGSTQRPCPSSSLRLLLPLSRSTAPRPPAPSPREEAAESQSPEASQEEEAAARSGSGRDRERGERGRTEREDSPEPEILHSHVTGTAMSLTSSAAAVKGRHAFQHQESHRALGDLASPEAGDAARERQRWQHQRQHRARNRRSGRSHHDAHPGRFQGAVAAGRHESDQPPSAVPSAAPRGWCPTRRCSRAWPTASPPAP